MKLKEVLNSINFEDKRIQTHPDWEELAQEFGIDLYWSEDERLKAYHVKTWQCTDTWVGWEAYFLDKELVCISSQNARKSDKDFEFISKESFIKVRDYLLSLTLEDEDKNINILDLELEIPEKYVIEYSNQILHKTAWLDNNKVEIIKKRYSYEEKDKYFHTVEIKTEDGNVREVDCRELLFDYNTLD